MCTLYGSRAEESTHAGLAGDRMSDLGGTLPMLDHDDAVLGRMWCDADRLRGQSPALAVWAGSELSRAALTGQWMEGRVLSGGLDASRVSFSQGC